jgi:hypothetical protein
MTRLCTVPGCQSRHDSHGLCNRHRHRWQAYGDPTASRRRTDLVEPQHVAEMVALAEEGLSRRDIAACTGWDYSTVRRHVGHLVSGVGAAKPDVHRYRRMLKAVAAAEYGSRDEIARRFGLKDARVLKVTLVTARRRVSEASQERLRQHDCTSNQTGA